MIFSAAGYFFFHGERLLEWANLHFFLRMKAGVLRWRTDLAFCERSEQRLLERNEKINDAKVAGSKCLHVIFNEKLIHGNRKEGAPFSRVCLELATI